MKKIALTVASLFVLTTSAHAGITLNEIANPTFKGRWYGVNGVRTVKMPCCKKVCKDKKKVCKKEDRPKKEKVIVLKGVNFDTGSAKLTPAAKEVLDDNVKTLKSAKKDIVIEGHTDSKGNDKANQKLSLARAKAVHDYFVKQGVKDSKISAVGKGESEPIASNDTESGRAKNRRIEIHIEK